MSEDLILAIKAYQPIFGLKLSNDVIEHLADFYDLVQEQNPVLHLVGPCSAAEFATRHILESLTLLKHLPNDARFADIGTGAGLPSIPCLIARPDLTSLLIESKAKKVGFLQMVLAKRKLTERAEIINNQFSEIKKPDISYVTCRALDKFTQNLPRLIKWSGNCTLLFFGGPTLGTELIKLGIRYTEKLMPMSERRYLFIVDQRK